VGRARQIRGRAVAGTLSVFGLFAAAFSIALVLAVPGGPAGATGSGSSAKTVKVSAAKVAGVGTVLTTASGLTLYRFTEDSPGVSTCTGACAKIWPPLLVSKGAHVSGPHGVKGFSLLSVGNGHWQVAFHKLPLYTFEGDKKKGQAHGQNVGKLWFAVLRSGLPASATAGTTSTTAPAAPSTQPVTSTTQGSSTSSGTSNNSSAGSGVTTPTQASTPATQPPTPVTQAPAPPTTTPTTSPPPASTTAPGSGGYGY
jgi:predicted lipoprotein with Yx(FWY)xxD motif